MTVERLMLSQAEAAAAALRSAAAILGQYWYCAQERGSASHHLRANRQIQFPGVAVERTAKSKKIWRDVCGHEAM
jgi:hypothetical protein